MRLQRTFALALGFLLAPGAVQAQTEEIQRKVETRLWILRVLARIESATGAPPFVSVLTLVALGIALVAAFWLGKASRKRRLDSPSGE